MTARATAESGDEIVKRAADFKAGQVRELYVYDVPADMAEQARGIRSIALRLLTPREMQMVYKRCGDDPMKMTDELAKAAIAEVNDEPVRLDDGSADEWWNRMHPAVRQLVQSGYVDLHAAPAEATRSFLASRRVKV
jgi:hypothetical protein